MLTGAHFLVLGMEANTKGALGFLNHNRSKLRIGFEFASESL